MSQQHLHSLIGKEIYACKKRFYERLKQGADLDTAIAQFVGELRLGLEVIAREREPQNLNSESVADSVS